jgi:hypothetical protein
VFYNRKHKARVVSIECGAVVSFVTIEIVQIRYDTSSRTVCIYMHCIALPCEGSSVVTEEEKKEKLIVEGFVRW